MYLVSACLAGEKCRYDGEAKPCQKVIDLVEKEQAVAVCPEQLAGLPTPRPATELRDDRVVTPEGEDMTRTFQEGARRALKIALASGCEQAILKSKSPSCGCGKVYDGTFTGKIVEGDGVFTQLLKEHGVSVKTEND